MLEKKRKAGDDEAERLPKKHASDLESTSQDILRVRHLSSPDILKPVIANSISVPQRLEYQSYCKGLPDGTSQLLLHSSNHPTIDFTAKEGDTCNDKYLKHYLAAFDPTTKQLELVEAKRLTVRSNLRRRRDEPESDEDQEATSVAPTTPSRMALTAAFGTKKSKKAAQMVTENRLLARGSDAANEPLSKALLSSIPATDPSDDDVPSPARANKPLPQPNLNTRAIDEVYSVASLVFPQPSSGTLEAMPVAHWLDSISKKKAIMTSSRFVSNRVSYLCSARLANPNDTNLLHLVQLLRYIYLLVEIYRFIRQTSTFKRLPTPNTWPRNTYSGNIEHALLDGVVKTFCPAGTGPSKNQLILFRSTIFALTLHIPPPSMTAGANTLVTEPTDIQLDLGVSTEEARKLYRELGCRLQHAKPTDLERWGVRPKKVQPPADEDGGGGGGGGTSGLRDPPQPKWALLKFPLDFPNVSAGNMRQRGGRRR